MCASSVRGWRVDGGGPEVLGEQDGCVCLYHRLWSSKRRHHLWKQRNDPSEWHITAHLPRYFIHIMTYINKTTEHNLKVLF